MDTWNRGAVVKPGRVPAAPSRSSEVAQVRNSVSDVGCPLEDDAGCGRAVNSTKGRALGMGPWNGWLLDIPTDAECPPHPDREAWLVPMRES
jgi:hypothetical protein